MLAALASVAGCSQDFWLGKRRYLSVEQTAGAVSPTTSEYSDDDFYVVRVNQLGEVRRRASLTYLGSDERFHYLRAWNKAVREGEVQYVALRKPDCRVSDPASIESEVASWRERSSTRPWRHVTVHGDICIVDAWSEQLSARDETE